jgi:hypothetical protein
VPAQDKGAHILDRDLHRLGKEVAEASRIQHACHPDDPRMRQARDLLHHPDHGIERVGDDDHKGVGTVMADVLAHRADHVGVGADQVVAAHAGLARHPGGDDDDVSPREVGIVACAAQGCVEALDWTALRKVEGLAGRHSLHDVEENDVPELLHGHKVGQRPPDLASANEGDFPASHGQGLFRCRFICMRMLWAAVLDKGGPVNNAAWPQPPTHRHHTGGC